MNDQEVINTTKSNVSLLEKKLTRFFSSLQEIDGFELDKAPNSGMYLFPNISTLYKKIPNSYQNNSVSESVANFIVPLWEKNPVLAVRRFNINFKYLIKKR